MARPKTTTDKKKQGVGSAQEQLTRLCEAEVEKERVKFGRTVQIIDVAARVWKRHPELAARVAEERHDPIDLDAEIAADAASAAPSPDILSRITYNGNTLLDLRKAFIDLTNQATKIAESIAVMEQQTLPALFDEAGVKIVGLDDADGHVMERAENVFASISKDNAAAAAAWLIKNGYGAIVKAKILVELEKEETKLLGIVRTALNEENIAFEESSAVNAATLKAFVKERLAAGTVLPSSISFHVQPIVTVKVPKKGKKK